MVLLACHSSRVRTPHAQPHARILVAIRDLVLHASMIASRRETRRSHGARAPARVRSCSVVMTTCGPTFRKRRWGTGLEISTAQRNPHVAAGLQPEVIL